MAEEPIVVESPQEVEAPAESTPAVEPQEEMVPKSVFLKRLNEETQKRKQYEEYVKSLQVQQTQQPITDDDGYIDPVKYKESIKAEIRQEMQAKSMVDQDWQSAVDAFPELKANTKLARAVRGTQREALLDGEFLTAREAAEQLLSDIQAQAEKAREAGRTEAQVSETVQKRMGIDPPSTSSSKSDNLLERFKSGKLSEAEQRANWSKIQQELLG